MTEKLKPCSFCGSRLVSYTRSIIGAPIVFMKYCQRCGAEMALADTKEMNTNDEE